MRRLLACQAMLCAAGLCADKPRPRETPAYSSAGVVNAADYQPALSPNAIGSLYGKGLAYTTESITSDDIRDGILPTVLPGTGVRVLIGAIPATIYYVSPTQINFLVPSILLPGRVNLQLVLDGLAGPSVPIELAAAAPALFPVATRADWSLITPESPAKPGDIVILYATGLGDTVPPVIYNQVPKSAAWLKRVAEFRVLFDGMEAHRSDVLYTGIAPGFAGLYQINVVVPADTRANPEIQLKLGDAISAPGQRLALQP